MLQQLSLPSLVSAGLVAFVTPVLAQLPYNPTRIVPAKDGSVAYLFSPQPSSTQFSLYALDTSDNVTSTSSKTPISDTLPFLSKTESNAFITISGDEGITVLAGNCQDPQKDLQLWKFVPSREENNGTWSQLELTAGDGSLGCNYLSAGFAFSPTASIGDAALYVFGGMCPNSTTTDTASWISNANYSNTMLTFAPESSSSNSSPYQLSLTGARAPPIAEAGLTITPLTPTFSNTSHTNVSQQQNFVLLGGHTQTAFINMSQLAIFSLPQESWAFVAVSQPASSGAGKLRRKDTSAVEPRSGHTAILTEDGSRIVVFGGWVGDVNTPAQPQLAILEVGQGYGGQADWSWTIPTSTSNPFPSDSGSGIYGHGVAMLPGGIMMVSGGYSIGTSATKSRRQVSSDSLLFLNTTSLEWASTYTNPYPSGIPQASSSADSSTTGLKPSERAGLGAGLGLGLAAAAGVAIVWLLYSRKLRERRALREKEIRELALGAERFRSPTPAGEVSEKNNSMRSASWGGIQERQLESSGDPFPWAPVALADNNGKVRLAVGAGGDSNDSRYAERTGVLMEIPSPTRGLRKNLISMAPTAPGPFNQHPPRAMGPGAVFRIEEEEEGSQAGSSRRVKPSKNMADTSSMASDPFKDPSPMMETSVPNDAATQRKKEVEGWVEDWQSAAETMSLSRSTSQAYSRTYSNLSQFRPAGSGGPGRGSPEKSDRTGSNLSDNSMTTSSSSMQKSAAGTVSRNISQRSASAGYTGYSLFSGAAAAMSRFGNMNASNTGPTRTPSNRSVSLNIDTSRRLNPDNTFTSARSAWGRTTTTVGEDQALLNRARQRQETRDRDYSTLADSSPSKDKYARAGSLTAGSGRRALNLLGSMKRVFTGSGPGDVHHDRSGFEAAQNSSQSSPTKHSAQHADMMATDADLNRAVSAGASFWQRKRGAKDWDDDEEGGNPSSSAAAVRRKPVPGGMGGKHNNGRHSLEDDEDDDDWDVETAVQKRVVQVMFTVPKEKLRVVNADALSLLSSNRSEADQEEDRDRQGDQVKRMSSVKEGDESHEHEHDREHDNDRDHQADNDDTTTDKGKGKEREG
ncbi:hypothetical protein ABEF95_001512 [Exophiala dermatitidis]